MNRPRGYGSESYAICAGGLTRIADEQTNRIYHRPFAPILRTPDDEGTLPRCRVLMKDGKWLIPESERPKMPDHSLTH